MKPISSINDTGIVAGIDTPGASKTVTAKGGMGKKALKYILYAIVAIFVIFTALSLIWQMSGSNKWELKIDRDGTQVYSLKAPGTGSIKFKGVTHYDYTYTELIALFNDTSFTTDPAGCEKFVPGCKEYKFLKTWDDQLLYNVQYWRLAIPIPFFAERETILKGSVVQDKESKVVLLENIAVPNYIPQNDCCVRVTHLHNTWKYTPVESGGVNVEFIQDFDMGGFFPDFLLSFGAEEVHKILQTDIPETIEKKKEEYRSLTLDFVEEY